MKHSLYAISLTSALMLHTPNSYALEINSVNELSNELNDKYVQVEILGTSFGAGPEMILFEDFSYGKEGDQVGLDLALFGNWSASSDYTGIPRYAAHEGDLAMSIHDFGKPSLNRIAQLEAILPDKTNDIFLSYSVRVPEGRYFSGATDDFTFPNVSSWKFTWIADGIGAIGSTTRFNLCTPTHIGSGNFMLQGNSGGLGYIQVRDNWSWHGKNYFSFGQIPDNDNPTTSNGMVHWSHISEKGSKLSINSDSPVMPLGVTEQFDRVKFPGWFGNGDYSNFDAYYDDIYVAIGDNALARVVLSDARDINQSTQLITLPVISWASNKITLKINRQLLEDNILPVFLHVHDRENNHTVVEFTNENKPKPPAGLSVDSAT
ncbi:MAG: hypothetical protein MK096_09650 [Oleiphilaceae bacterium]|nr:hypothetical protein [Oleiphilaceae bacterium]